MFERKCVFPRIILSNLAHPGECFSPEDEHWLQIEFQMSSELEVEYKVFWLIPPSVESPNAGWLVPQSKDVFWTLNRLSQFKSCIFPFESSSLYDFEDGITKPWVCEIFRFPTQTPFGVASQKHSFNILFVEVTNVLFLFAMTVTASDRATNVIRSVCKEE